MIQFIIIQLVKNLFLHTIHMIIFAARLLGFFWGLVPPTEPLSPQKKF